MTNYISSYVSRYRQRKSKVDPNVEAELQAYASGNVTNVDLVVEHLILPAIKRVYNPTTYQTEDLIQDGLLYLEEVVKKEYKMNHASQASFPTYALRCLINFYRDLMRHERYLTFPGFDRLTEYLGDDVGMTPELYLRLKQFWEASTEEEKEILLRAGINRGLIRQEMWEERKIEMSKEDIRNRQRKMKRSWLNE